jgi:hypothetical protein
VNQGQRDSRVSWEKWERCSLVMMGSMDYQETQDSGGSTARQVMLETRSQERPGSKESWEKQGWTGKLVMLVQHIQGKKDWQDSWDSTATPAKRVLRSSGKRD